ncbi:MAG TPA: hypothetical protein DCO77_02320 [Nitrospiraceae bacterium]|nr:hypothetical protein [Nitrospiraceae bacterium]
MNVLVTGGTGFIGSHVVDVLVEHGHTVRLFSRRPDVPERLQGRGVSVLQGDLRDAESVVAAMNGMDVFYHIGEMKNTTRSAPEENIRLVEKIVRHLGPSGVKRFVFVISITVAGIPAEIPATEKTRPAVALRDQYTTYKKKSEDIIFRGSHGAECVILRPPMVYGPGSRYLGRMITLFQKATPLGLPFAGKGRNIVPLIHVKDLAWAIYLAGIQEAAAGQLFNLTDGLRHTWFDVFSALAGALQIKLRILSLPPVVLRIPALVADFLCSLFGLRPDSNNYVTFLASHVLFDNAKAKVFLGWEPGYTDLVSGMQDMVEQYRGESR